MDETADPALSKNPSVLSPQRAMRAQSFKTAPILAGVSDASAFSACSAVKFKDIVISLDFPIVPADPLRRKLRRKGDRKPCKQF